MPKNNESKEMYLEVIYDLYTENDKIHSIDIARKLGYSKPSVARAISNLKKDAYIVQEPYGPITLTNKGMAIAKLIKDRHIYLTKFLSKSLGISDILAEKDACRIEHVISHETMEAVRAYVDKPDN